MGVPTYRVLDNVVYNQQFQFVPPNAAEKQRNQRSADQSPLLHDDSEAQNETEQERLRREMNVVHVALNLPFVHQEKINHINFETI